MTNDAPLLEGLSVIELSAFVAAPLGGSTLASLGAEVIRIDPPGGGLDHRRLPVDANGESYYWAGLNKGKKSVEIDYRRPEGQALVLDLIRKSGTGGGCLLTNLGGTRWLAHEEITRHRADAISVRIDGNFDGSIAVDYTVNCAVGLPAITGTGGASAPTNHVLPAWDIATGLYAATAILAADRQRLRTGRGAEVSIALSDVAIAALGHLGMLSEVQAGLDREPIGNRVHGAFGRDFATSDGRRIMLVALSERHWQAIVAATEMQPFLECMATEGRPIDGDAARVTHRGEIEAHVAAWCGALPFETVVARLDGAKACWGPYQTMRELLAGDRRASLANPMMGIIEHRSIGAMLTASSPIAVRGAARHVGMASPRLGQDTRAVLEGVLGMGRDDLDALARHGLIGGAPAKDFVRRAS